MSDCLHCDINELVQQRIDKGDVDIAQMASLIAETLADLILLTPETEQSKLIADLPIIWGGESPGFRNTREAEEILGAIMSRYNQILYQCRMLQTLTNPIFWGGPDGLVIAMDWADGFLDAVVLRPKAWSRLFMSKNGRSFILPIAALWPDDAKQKFQMTDANESDWIEIAADYIPNVVVKIHRFWKSK